MKFSIQVSSWPLNILSQFLWSSHADCKLEKAPTGPKFMAISSRTLGGSPSGNSCLVWPGQCRGAFGVTCKPLTWKNAVQYWSCCAWECIQEGIASQPAQPLADPKNFLGPLLMPYTMLRHAPYPSHPTHHRTKEFKFRSSDYQSMQFRPSGRHSQHEST